MKIIVSPYKKNFYIAHYFFENKRIAKDFAEKNLREIIFCNNEGKWIETIKSEDFASYNIFVSTCNNRAEYYYKGCYE